MIFRKMTNYQVRQFLKAASCGSSRASSCLHSGESGCCAAISGDDGPAGHKRRARLRHLLRLGALEEGDAGLSGREPPGQIVLRLPNVGTLAAGDREITSHCRGRTKSPTQPSLAFTKSQRLEGKVGRSSGEGF
jgi:hypothetical protein